MFRSVLRLGLLMLAILTASLPTIARAQDNAPPDASGPIKSETPKSSESLDATFGGTRESFEVKYGEPSKPDAGDYPRGDDYRIDGFKRVSAFFNDEQIVHLTLTAPTDEFWTTKEAENALVDFLPTDSKFGTPVKNIDNEPVTRARSNVLAGVIDQSVYDTFEANGKPGDYSYTFQLDKQGQVKAIDIELGRVAAVSDEEREYWNALRKQFDVLATSMDEFDTALDDLTAGTIDVDAAAQIFLKDWTIWRQAAANAAALSPADSQQSTHDLYVQMTSLLSSAADDYQSGIVNNDSTLLNAGDTKYGQARGARILIESLLTVAGV